MTATSTALVLPDEQALDRAADPAQYVIAVCERAKTWLAMALSPHGLAEDESIGVAIRKGQEAGEIRTQAEALRLSPNRDGEGDTSSIRSPSDFLPKYDLSNSQGGIYALTDDVSDEQSGQGGPVSMSASRTRRVPASSTSAPRRGWRWPWTTGTGPRPGRSRLARAAAGPTPISIMTRGLSRSPHPYDDIAGGSRERSETYALDQEPARACAAPLSSLVVTPVGD